MCFLSPDPILLTRSLTKELLTPFKDPEKEFRSSRKLFKTLSLDESRSPVSDIFFDLEENSEEEVAETMARTMEQYMSKTRADYGSRIARPKIIIYTKDQDSELVFKELVPPIIVCRFTFSEASWRRRGKIKLWDAIHCKKVRTTDGHTKFVGTLAWSSSMLYSGSHDTSILQRDPRAHKSFDSELNGPKSGRSKKWSQVRGGIPAIPDQTQFDALKIQWEMWTRTQILYNQLILRQKYHMRRAGGQNTEDLLHTLLRLKYDGG
ncbi:hypothetical protein Tco_0802064 [Tanacetum coccineum]|uniref:Uncharacterized protein n=1 Tax=Tanacetum coccineum TaxID=301880 RepID=A0ABQ5A025_9ASTR